MHGVRVTMDARRAACPPVSRMGRVFRSADDPNDVVVLQDVADVAKARTWIGSDDLKAAIQKDGVLGSPSIRFAA
jgi:hypothetical protein